MSKDEAIGRLVRLAEQCDEQSVVRLCNEVEETLEIGPYGVCTWTDPRAIDTAVSPPDEALLDAADLDPAAPDPKAWEVVAACTAG